MNIIRIEIQIRRVKNGICNFANNDANAMEVSVEVRDGESYQDKRVCMFKTVCTVFVLLNVKQNVERNRFGLIHGGHGSHGKDGLWFHWNGVQSECDPFGKVCNYGCRVVCMLFW